MMENAKDKHGHTKRCINCGLASHTVSKYYISSLQPKCQEILKHWTGCKNLTNYQVCKRCRDIVEEYSESNETSIPEKRMGCAQVCIGCGISVLRRQSMKIKEELIPIAKKLWLWYNILQIDKICCCKCVLRLQRFIQIENRIIRNNDFGTTDSEFETTSRELETSNCELETTTSELETTNSEFETPNSELRTTMHEITNNFYKIVKKHDPNELQTKLKTTTKMLKFTAVVTKTSKLSEIVKKLDKNNFPRLDTQLNIILSSGKRTPATKKCCFSRQCRDSSRKLIPKSKRRLLATNHNLFIPGATRVCGNHISFDNYDPNHTKNILSHFTVPQFEMFVDQMKQGMVVLDFENVEAMADHICKYWTGLRVIQFVQMYDGIKQTKLMKSALAAYLIRKITGDSVQKLAKLFNINSFTLKKQIRAVEIHFSKKQ